MLYHALAIIPARGGSKRIPRKNIRMFIDKPIITYSIQAALQSGCFDEIMVSTEDYEISQIAQEYGAMVPFMRSGELSNDMAGLTEVIEEVLLTYKKQSKEFQYVCCLLPTAPLVTNKILRDGYDLLVQTGADSVVPVTRFSYPIQRAFKIENGQLKMFWPENYSMRSQDLEPAFHDCGQFYWMSVQSLIEQKTIFAKHTVPLEIPESRVQDIDVEEDWKMAEMKYKDILSYCDQGS